MYRHLAIDTRECWIFISVFEIPWWTGLHLFQHDVPESLNTCDFFFLKLYYMRVCSPQTATSREIFIYSLYFLPFKAIAIIASRVIPKVYSKHYLKCHIFQAVKRKSIRCFIAVETHSKLYSVLFIPASFKGLNDMRCSPRPKTTISQDVQTRFPVQLAFDKFLSRIKGNFLGSAVSMILELY